MNSFQDVSVGEIIELAKSGCGRSQGQLLERYRKYLTMLARIQFRRSLRAKADASDVVQEVFLHAHAAFDQFRGQTEQEFIGWLRAILASRLAHLVRTHAAQRRRIQLERRLSDELQESSAALDGALVDLNAAPCHLAMERERLLTVVSAIEDLPDDYRTVLLLRQIESLPFDEVAKSMDRTVDSVKKLWVRALARLQRAMESTGDH